MPKPICIVYCLNKKQDKESLIELSKTIPLAEFCIDCKKRQEDNLSKFCIYEISQVINGKTD